MRSLTWGSVFISLQVTFERQSFVATDQTSSGDTNNTLKRDSTHNRNLRRCREQMRRHTLHIWRVYSKEDCCLQDALCQIQISLTCHRRIQRNESEQVIAKNRAHLTRHDGAQRIFFRIFWNVLCSESSSERPKGATVGMKSPRKHITVAEDVFAFDVSAEST